MHYVQMLTGLERHLRVLPDDWDRQSIGSLAKLADEQAEDSVSERAAPSLPQNLDTVRGLACVLIVALHVVGAASTEGLKIPAGSPWHSFMDALNLVRLPLFTAISGYLYAAMPATRFGMADFMRRKSRQLLIPLAFATLVFWGLRNAVYHRSDSLFWAFVDGYQHLWFIDALLLIFAFVSFVDTRARSNVVWPIVLLAVAATWWLIPNVPILHVRRAVFLLPFFVVGILLFHIPRLEIRRLGVPALLVAFGVLMLLRVPGLAEWAVHDRSGILQWVGGSAWVIAFIGLFPKIMPLEQIAPYSFTIYLWHPAANGAVRDILIRLGLHSIPVLFGIGLAMGVTLPIALHRVMLRFPVLSVPILGR